MPRSARTRSNTGIYHIMLRGINRDVIFRDQSDHKRFIKTLAECKEKSDYQLYAYCLMSNHVHLLLKEGAEDIGNIMKRIGASFVYWYNWKYDRVGHLFQSRFKSEPVETDSYLLTVLRYIHQNPVKANMVKDCSKYLWSSYNDYIRNSDEDSIVDADYLLNIFHKDAGRAFNAFKEFHKKDEEVNCLEVEELKRIKDEQAIEIMQDVCLIMAPDDFKNIPVDDRDPLLRQLKENGLTTRQIARLTGVSRNTVVNA